MLRPLALTTLLVAGFCGLAQADVYRWVDEHGEPHYSDRWVPGSQLIKTSKPHAYTPDSTPDPNTPPASSSPQNKAPSANANQSAATKQQQQAAEAVKQDVAKVKEAQCKQAKERYQKAIEARRIYKPPKEGDTDRAFMTDEETDAYRVQARNDVTLACGSPPPPVQPSE
jgi:Domain of unknown function (DUF4124)